MNVTWTALELAAFEEEIAQLFLEKKIHAPVHLSKGNEQQLIDIFRKHVGPSDWVCCTWRSHFHALLKGVPREQVKQAILDGHSIALCFPEYRAISSAMVGGMAPIAVGLAMGIARKEQRQYYNTDHYNSERCGTEHRKVVCFLGDMAAHSGIVFESSQYALHHQLPLLWVVEDNGKSVCTDTREVWGSGWFLPGAIGYRYKNSYPHCGLAEWVTF